MVIFPVDANWVRAMDFVVLKGKYYILTQFVQNCFFNFSDVVDLQCKTQIYYVLGLICNLPLRILNHITHIFNPNESVLLNNATY